LSAGEPFPLGGASVRTLWPAPSALAADAAEGPSRGARSRRSRHDDSLVLRISIASSSVLLPGDIDERVEQELARSPAPLASEALKVARHGARTSSGPEFLARVSPRIAILSAESGSPRNSPNPETLERIQAAGARIFRTDTDGAVTVEMRGASLSVHTFAPDGQGFLELPSP
jgi:beta-lactamase superfamily II metal-dependent hydrolase